MTRSKLHYLLIVFLLSLVLSSCGPAAGAEEQPDLQATLAAMYAQETAQAVMVEPPAQPAAEQPVETSTQEPAKDESQMVTLNLSDFLPDPYRILKDSRSDRFASEHKATQGDNFLNGLYERPFTSEEMIYQPDLDIITVDFAPGEDYFYFTIRLYGMNIQGGGLQGVYSIEFDRTLTGRGDLLVTVKNPANEWSMEGVTVYGDENRDVGGPQPVVADPGFNGSGYDTEIEMDVEKHAFARIDPEDGNAVQFAVSYALVETPEEFLWGAWADNGLMDPAQFDYNDRMGPTAAGSPIKDKYYPLKELYNLDNTCRLPYGLAQFGTVPGMCKIGVPTPQPQSSDKTHCECVEWTTVYFGQISVRLCVREVCN